MYNFRKTERLCSKKIISDLYTSQNKSLIFPLSAHWLFLEENHHCKLQVLIVAPKKKLHHAVDRNRTKRLIRECYRLRKHLIIDALEQRGLAMALSINYIHNSLPDYHQLEQTFDKLFATILEELPND